MIYICEASYPVHVNMRKGTVMSMLHTATGRVFAAWLAPRIAQHYIEREAGDKAVVINISKPARSAEHTSELQSLMRISYDVFRMKKQQLVYTIRITTKHI